MYFQVALRASTAAAALLLSTHAFAFSNLTLGANVGQLDGRMHQYTLNPNLPAGGGNRLAEFEWELDEVKMVGVDAAVDFGRYLTVRGEYWTDADGGSGKSVGQLWDPAFAGNPTGGLTPYSDDASTDQGYFNDSPIDGVEQIELSAAIKPVVSFDLGTAKVQPHILAGYRQDNFAMSNVDGFGTTSINAFRDDSFSFAGNQPQFRYEQEYATMFIGAGASTSVNGVDIAVEGAIGRYDLTTTEFDVQSGGREVSEIRDGEMHKLRADVSTNLSRFGLALPGVMMSAGIDYVRYDKTTGNSTVYNSNGTSATVIDGAAAESEVTTYSIGLKKRF